MEAFIYEFPIEQPLAAPPVPADPFEDAQAIFDDLLDMAGNLEQLLYEQYIFLLDNLDVAPEPVGEVGKDDIEGNIQAPIPGYILVNAAKQFHFTLEEVHEIAECLNLPEVFISENGTKIGRIEGLCLLLYWLSYPQWFSDSEVIFPGHESTLSWLFQIVAEYIY